MERSVRYIQLPNAGIKPALCFRGRKVAHCIINDETRVRVVEVPLPDHDKASLVQYHGGPYLPSAFASKIRSVGKRKGMTQRAVALIHLPPEIEELPELPPDEPVVLSVEPSSTRLVIGPEADIPAAESRERRKTGSSGRQPKSSGTAQPSNRGVPPSVKCEPLRGKVPEPPKTSTAPAPRVPNPSRASQGSRPEKQTERSSSAIRSSKPADRPSGAPQLEGQTAEGTKSTLVRQLALELGIAEQPLRVKLRAAGLRAPYTDLELMRKAAKK
jgi:hypothetical protein